MHCGFWLGVKSCRFCGREANGKSHRLTFLTCGCFLRFAGKVRFVRVGMRSIRAMCWDKDCRAPRSAARGRSVSQRTVCFATDVTEAFRREFRDTSAIFRVIAKVSGWRNLRQKRLWFVAQSQAGGSAGRWGDAQLPGCKNYSTRQAPSLRTFARKTFSFP